MRMILALAELEAAACLWLTRLLTFNGTGVACEEALVLEGLLVFSVNLHQCAGDGETQSLALTGEAATVEVCLDVILLNSVEQKQWLLYYILENS